jgi:hypothetical protein
MTLFLDLGSDISSMPDIVVSLPQLSDQNFICDNRMYYVNVRLTPYTPHFINLLDFLNHCNPTYHKTILQQLLLLILFPYATGTLYDTIYLNLPVLSSV